MKLDATFTTLALVLAATACGDSSARDSNAPLAPTPSADPNDTEPTGLGDGGGGGRTDGGASASDASASDATTGGADPTKNGPYATAELDATAHVSATGDDVPLHVVYPTSGGPFPVVVFAHGFQIASSNYYGYVRRLATFGYVAIAADYPAGFTSANNVRDAQNVSGALDWAASASQLSGKVSAQNSGVFGHSRGGKAAALAAARDTRFSAMLGLDPVDSKPPTGCNETTECPDSRAALAGRAIPTAFLGETTDATGGTFGQACAPADGNFATYYAKVGSPSLQVTVVGANHVSFVDDPQACGLTCAFCKAETAQHAQVLGLAYAMTVAFFERHLRGNAAYQTWLDGAQAKALWATPGLATIQSK